MVQVEVALEENVLVVISTIRVEAIMNGTIGVTKTTRTNNNEIKFFDGVWMAFCGKCQTWSGAPNAHTTGC